MAGMTRTLPLRRGLHMPTSTFLLCSFVLLIVAFSVVFPVFLIVLESFNVAKPGEATRYGLDGWRAAFSEPLLRNAIWNTLKITIARQTISLPVALLLAWLLARTDLPGRDWLEFGFWAAFFLPSLTVTLSWILLLDSDYGLVNDLLRKLPFITAKQGPFNIYSFWGIVWVHLVSGSIIVKVILLTPAFRNMNSSLEEASRVAGANNLGTALRITFPVMLPVILSVFLIAVMRSLETFEVEQVLGIPARIFVYSTMIYDLLVTRVPRYDAATALGVLVLAVMLPLVFLQQRLIAGRRYTTVTGQSKTQPVKLGAWRWPAFAFVCLSLVIVLVAPMVFAVLGTFMKLFGFFNIAEPWTMNNWKVVLQDPLFIKSMKNTLILAVGTAVTAVLIHSLIAYIVVRTKYAGRGALDFISWLPFTVPGLLLGLAFLWMVLRIDFLKNALYGSMGLLIIVGVVSGMPLGVQIIKSSLLQLGGELEEASWIAGASWWSTYRRIVLRLLAPTLVAVGMITFIGAARNIGTVALLSTSANRPLSILQLDYIAQRKFEAAVVIACIIMIVSLVGALGARMLGLRQGLG